MSRTMLTTEKARTELVQEFPDLVMEISEYLSFADIENLTKDELIEDFTEYMEK